MAPLRELVSSGILGDAIKAAELPDGDRIAETVDFQAGRAKVGR